MHTIDYCYFATSIAFIYLAILISKKTYRLLLPSVLHTTAWLITTCLLIFQLKGWLVSYKLEEEYVALSSRYIFFLIISSVIGFTFAHLISHIKREQRKVTNIPLEYINHILKQYKWIPYLCIFNFNNWTICNFWRFSRLCSSCTMEWTICNRKTMFRSYQYLRNILSFIDWIQAWEVWNKH